MLCMFFDVTDEVCSKDWYVSWPVFYEACWDKLSARVFSFKYDWIKFCASCVNGSGKSRWAWSNDKYLIESFVFTDSDLIFADPPYLLSSIRSGKNYYPFRFTTHDHIEFLNYMISCNANIMITHPECNLYSSMLPEWNIIPFSYMTRGGIFRDCLYTNFSIGPE